MPIKNISHCDKDIPDLETYLGHTTINDEVGAVDEAGLITGQEDNSVCLLDGFTETSGREVNLAALTLSLVVTQPVLQKRSVEWSRAESVESKALTCVHNGELTGHGEDCTLASCVCQLRCGSTDQGNHGSSVDDGTLGLVVLAQCLHCVL